MSAEFEFLHSRQLMFFAALLTTVLPSRATSLVNGFNVVILGDFTSQNTDIEGTLAVAANLTLQNASLNLLAPNPNSTAAGFDTVAGGNLMLTNGTVYGKTFASSATLTNVNACTNCISTGGTAPLNFQALNTGLKAESTFLYQLSATGSTTFSNGLLRLVGSSSSPLQVFTVDASQLGNASTIDLENIGANTTVLINVGGSGSISTSAGGLQIAGTQTMAANNVVFNFSSGITNVSIANSFYASILAPYAAVSAGYGSFNGDLVAASYGGNEQFNLDGFDGNLPCPPASAPEPGSMSLLMASGAVALFAGITVRKRRLKN